MSRQPNRTHLPEKDGPAESRTQDEEVRYQKAAALLHEWMREDDGYDREVWPLVEEELSRSGGLNFSVEA